MVTHNERYVVLPDEYHQVEWIENTNNQYISTGVVANQNTGFYIDFLTYKDLNTSTYGCIFGARTRSMVNEYQLTTYSYGNSTTGSFRKNEISIVAGIFKENRIQCSATINTYTNPSNFNQDLPTTEYTTPCDISLFALNENGTKIQNGLVRLYSFKSYNGNELIRDYIPCYRISDNKVGLYDIVNNTFNTDGSGGNFIYGDKLERLPNKIIFDDNVLIDLTEDTVDSNRMYKGDVAHAADGSTIIGTAEVTVDGTTLIMPDGLITPLGIINPDTNHWIRPENLPNLDSLYNNENNLIFMTVDATGRLPDPHICIKLWSACTVQVGHIQNNEFIVDSTDSVANGGIWEKSWTPETNFYPIIKITSNEIRGIQWQSYTSASGHIYAAYYQSVVEWIGCMNYGDSSTHTPYFVEREKINVKTANSNFLGSRWANAWYLMDLDVSEWNTTSWNITSLGETWRNCYSLVTLDLSSWDTSNWKVTSMNNTWNYCYSLESIDTTNWNTTQFIITGFGYTWYGCYKLKSLNLNHWNTSNWTVSTLYQTWAMCLSLENLQINEWNTSKWTIASLYQTWYCCTKLKNLDLSLWNTSNWTVTTIAGTWQYCDQLQSLQINEWDTSNWNVSVMSSTWYACYELLELILNHWDTSNWSVTTMVNTWTNCYKLKVLEINNWDTSNWQVNTLAATWQNCISLIELNLNHWDTSNWEVTLLTNTWNTCRALKKLHISNWDTSNWAVTSLANTWRDCNKLEEFEGKFWDTSNWEITDCDATFYYCYSIKSLDLHWDISNWNIASAKSTAIFRNMVLLQTLDLSGINISYIPNWKGSSSAFAFQYDYMLTNIIFGENNNNKLYCNDYSPIRFTDSNLLTRESILNIFNALKNGVTDKTLQLGSINLSKVTEEEKTIATNKGWTLT